LQARPRLVGEHVDLLAGFGSRADHSERCAVSSGRECAGVAVREYGRDVWNQRRTLASLMPTSAAINRIDGSDKLEVPKAGF
jgi:hypothetical protein